MQRENEIKETLEALVKDIELTHPTAKEQRDSIIDFAYSKLFLLFSLPAKTEGVKTKEWQEIIERLTKHSWSDYYELSETETEAEVILKVLSSQFPVSLPTEKEMIDKYSELRESMGMYYAIPEFAKWLRSKLTPSEQGKENVKEDTLTFDEVREMFAGQGVNYSNDFLRKIYFESK